MILAVQKKSQITDMLVHIIYFKVLVINFGKPFTTHPFQTSCQPSFCHPWHPGNWAQPCEYPSP